MFKYFKRQRYDIVCLQETHVTRSDIPIWEKQWGGRIIHVEGTTHSKGEIILVSRHLKCDVEVLKQRSRMLIIKLTCECSEFIIANVYAPNNRAEKLKFFDLLIDCLEEYKTKDVILVGDFNSVIDNDLDIVADKPHCLC